jgi:hypothetical protein
MKHLKKFFEQKVKLPGNLTSAESDATSTGPKSVDPLMVSKKAKIEKEKKEKIAKHELNADGSPLTPEQKSRKKSFEKGELKGIDPNYEKALADVENIHEYLLVAELGAAFIPVVGPFASTFVSLIDASLYYSKGDNENAGLALLFTLIPGSIALKSSIPFLKTLGKGGLKSLFTKLTKGQLLDQAEKRFLVSLKSNEKLVIAEIEKQFKIMLDKTPQIKQSFLKRFGKGSFKLVKILGAYSAVGLAYTWVYEKLNGEQVKLDDLVLDQDIDIHSVNKDAGDDIDWSDSKYQ